MSLLRLCPGFSVIVLTLCILSGCSSHRLLYQDPCTTRSYLDGGLLDHINRRFHSNAPIRMAVIPFSFPANLAAFNTDHRGLGNRLAWQVHSELLHREEIPIVEVFNRQDWPGKRDEFYTGNFGALQRARAAGYDLVLVGMLKDLTSLTSLTSDVKIIEVESGTTLWYARTMVGNNNYISAKNKPWYSSATAEPANLQIDPLVTTLGQCIAAGIIEDEKSSPGWDL